MPWEEASQHSQQRVKGKLFFLLYSFHDQGETLWDTPHTVKPADSTLGKASKG